jgi:hypothetical protein
MTDINFTVTASHKSPRFNFVDEPVRVRQYAGTELFYAVGKLGCSKNHATPEDAALSLFIDHWCTNVRVTKV